MAHDDDHEGATQDPAEILQLAERAAPLISRRAMLAAGGRKLLLPTIATFFVSRDAMAAGGSGPIGKGSWGSSRLRSHRLHHRRRRG